VWAGVAGKLMKDPQKAKEAAPGAGLVAAVDPKLKEGEV
jgi:hypothetical protein